MVGSVAKATRPIRIAKREETGWPPLYLPRHKVLDNQHRQVCPCGYRARDMAEERPLPPHDAA
jgi:hypothetical protein